MSRLTLGVGAALVALILAAAPSRAWAAGTVDQTEPGAPPNASENGRGQQEGATRDRPTSQALRAARFVQETLAPFKAADAARLYSAPANRVRARGLFDLLEDSLSEHSRRLASRQEAAAARQEVAKALAAVRLERSRLEDEVRRSPVTHRAEVSPAQRRAAVKKPGSAQRDAQPIVGISQLRADRPPATDEERLARASSKAQRRMVAKREERDAVAAAYDKRMAALAAHKKRALDEQRLASVLRGRMTSLFTHKNTVIEEQKIRAKAAEEGREREAALRRARARLAKVRADRVAAEKRLAKLRHTRWQLEDEGKGLQRQKARLVKLADARRREAKRARQRREEREEERARVAALDREKAEREERMRRNRQKNEKEAARRAKKWREAVERLDGLAKDMRRGDRKVTELEKTLRRQRGGGRSFADEVNERVKKAFGQ